jgi:metal-dependent amidase/aminoacylase/carboxypeptidase family protein
MVHPADADMIEMNTLASIGLIVTYTGRAAHAAAAPHHGRNALDAAVLGYNAVAALRQHIAPDERVLGVFTEVPQKVNVIPERVVTRWSLRSTTLARAQQLEPRVMACLESGAVAAGCQMEVTHLGVTEEVRTNRALTASYVANMKALGRRVGDPVGGGGTVGSTDMGHISYLMPVIHPLIAIAPPGVTIHETAFAAAAASEAADRAVIEGAKALAMTIVDYWVDSSLRARARAEFEVATT